MNRAREKLVKLAKKLGVELRQTYMRVGKFALVKHSVTPMRKQFRDPDGNMVKGYGANTDAAHEDRIRQENAYNRRHADDELTNSLS